MKSLLSLVKPEGRIMLHLRGDTNPPLAQLSEKPNNQHLLSEDGSQKWTPEVVYFHLWGNKDIKWDDTFLPWTVRENC